MGIRRFCRPQFSTKAMLALVLVASLPMAWVAAKRNQRQKERDAVAAIERRGGFVSYNWERDDSDPPPGSRWLRAVLGEDFFVRVVGVMLHFKEELTDADIAPLEFFTELEELSLDHTCISDAGLSHLRHMPRLRILDLDETRVTDASIARLKTFVRLERLGLKGTLVTAAGIAELQAALPNCTITRYNRSDEGGYRELPPIHDAAKAGDVETIRGELAAGVPVDLRISMKDNEVGGDDEFDGTTPLMWAASRGQVEAVRFLLAAGADVNAKNSDEVTPLMAAAGAIQTLDGDPLDCLLLLLKAGARFNDADGEGRTAFFYSCGEGAFFDEPPNAFLPPEFRLPDPFRGIRPDVGGSIGAHHFASRRFRERRHGDAGRIAALLAAGADPGALDSNGASVLMCAASTTDAQRLRLLLDAGADVRYRSPGGGSALRSAADGGDFEMFTMLMNAAAEPSEGLLACAAGSDLDAAEKVQLLLDRGANVDEPGLRGETPLIASLYGESTAAPLLLRAGASPHGHDVNGESTFLLAARNGPAEAVQRFLELGFDPNERSEKWYHATALIVAAESDRDAAEKVRFLVSAGANIEAQDDRRWTALFAASAKGNMQAVVALVEAGAVVNIAVGRHRMTPLLCVANRGEDDTFMCDQTSGAAARALILHGADVHATDDRGRTARIMAEVIHHTEVLQVLDEFGG